MIKQEYISFEIIDLTLSFEKDDIVMPSKALYQCLSLDNIYHIVACSLVRCGEMSGIDVTRP